MTLNRIGIMSCGKLMGVLYAFFGLIFGLLFSAIALIGAAVGAGMSESSGPEAMVGALFGVGAVIILPVLYGIFGFLSGLLTAALYNLVARFTGGLELELS